jgi:hypothetical protein
MPMVAEYLKKAADLEALAGVTKDALLKRSYLDQAMSYKLLAADMRRCVPDGPDEKDRVA